MSLLAPQLAGFLAVAEAKNISAAAKRLHLSQPAVSKQLRALEDALGVKLVQRTARGIRLTDAGELLSERGRRSAALLAECQVALAELATGQAGKLTLGAGVTTSALQLPGWLRSYRQRWPRVDIRVRTGASREVAEMVREREVDCGFVTSPVAKTGLSVRPLFREPIVLVAAAGASHPKQVELEELPLIMFPEGSGFRRFLERAFAEAGLSAQVQMEIDSVEATKGLVAAGLGGAFLPASAVERELAHRQLIQLRVRGLPRLQRQTSLVQRDDQRPSSALRNLLKLIIAPAPG